MSNSRFKFRVWDGEKYFNDNVFLLPTGELGFFVNSMGNPSHRTFQHQENFTIEQCTGLEDRKGRLIFEGDRCRVYDSKTGQPVKDTVYEVAFTESASGGCACFCFLVYHSGKIYGVRPIYANGLPNIEVVGTIHDAPDTKDGSKDQFRDATKKMEENR